MASRQLRQEASTDRCRLVIGRGMAARRLMGAQAGRRHRRHAWQGSAPGARTALARGGTMGRAAAKHRCIAVCSWPSTSPASLPSRKAFFGGIDAAL